MPVYRKENGEAVAAIAAVRGETDVVLTLRAHEDPDSQKDDVPETEIDAATKGWLELADRQEAEAMIGYGNLTVSDAATVRW